MAKRNEAEVPVDRYDAIVIGTGQAGKPLAKALAEAGRRTLVIERRPDQLLGAAALGIEGGELMSALQIAMMGRLPVTRLRDGIFAHPTLCESFNTLFWNFAE